MKRCFLALLALALLASAASAHGYGRGFNRGFHGARVFNYGGYGRGYDYGCSSAFYAVPYVPQTVIYTYTAVPAQTYAPPPPPPPAAAVEVREVPAPALEIRQEVQVPTYSFQTLDYGAYSPGCAPAAYGAGYSNYYGRTFARGFRGRHHRR